MTFLNIKKRVASNIGYVDSSGDILASKDITATDIGNSVNDRYLDELFPTLSTQYPEDFTRKGKFDFYKTTGTVSAASTETTLVATGNIFNNGMVGDTVYNEDMEEDALITAYTSATTVTIDKTIDDSWDGDTIYVLGHEFGLGGNATDARNLLYVGVKYSANDNYYTTCERQDENRLFLSGSETYSKTSPIWYTTTISVDGVPTTAIGILPEPSEPIASGVFIRYNEQPAAMSVDADVPRLPLGSHSLLVVGATADMLRKLMRLDEADRYEQRYQMGKMEMITSYALTRASGVPKIRPSRRVSNMVNRNI
jgi:hypothetical protein